MRRLWIACGILAALFAAALYNTWHLDRLTASLSDQLTRAEACAEAGNWEEAARLTEEAFDEWDSHTVYLHVLLRHADTDEVYTSFREVEGFLRTREPQEYAASNARLIARLELVASMEQFNLQNLL